MFEPRKMHPIAIFQLFLSQLKDIIFPFVALFFIGGKPSEWGPINFLISGVILIIFLTLGFLSWFYFSYYVVGRELRIENGIFVKKKRYIPFERIQSLDFTEGILHRPFGLVKVKIETAGGTDEAEAQLIAISKKDAAELKRYIQQQKREYTADQHDGELVEKEEQEKTILYQLKGKELIILASTSGGVGVIVSAIIAFLLQFDELIPYDAVMGYMKQFITNGIAFISLIIFAIFLLLWVVSLVVTMLKYSNFMLVKGERDLIITRGLLEKKQITIPLQRIQAIKIKENILRQPFQLASVYIISASGSLTDNESTDVVAIPLIKRKKIATLIQQMVSEYVLPEKFISPPKHALGRYLIKSIWFGFIFPIPVACIYFFPPWGYLSLLLIIFFLLSGYISYQSAGWSLDGKQLTISSRQIDKVTLIMKKNRIQSLDYTEGIWQRKGDLASVHGVVASGLGGTHASVADIKKEDVDRIYEWYSYEDKE